VDDVLVISGDPDAVIQGLKEHFTLKVVSDPSKAERYLGAMIGRYQFADGSQGWYMSADDYLSKAIPTVEAACDEKLNKKYTSPLPPNYHPELDTSTLLDQDGVSLYASFIGILQWAAELGRVDLAHSVALMSRFFDVRLEKGTWRRCYVSSVMLKGTIGLSSSWILRTEIGPTSLGAMQTGRSFIRMRRNPYRLVHRKRWETKSR
jgi:hypothetical protein